MAYYQIAVNEEQVEIIKEALKAYQTTPGIKIPALWHKEVRLLHGMFGDLKDDESNYCIQEQPKNIGERVHILHGFCF